MREKMMKILFPVFILCVILGSFKTQAASPSLKLSEKRLVLEVGENYTIKAKNALAVEWSCDSDAIMLKKAGKTLSITAVKPGKAKICAKAGKKEGVCKVTVSKLPFSKRRVEALSIFQEKNKIFWDKVPGAQGYKIYKYNHRTKKRTLIKTIRNGNKLEYKFKKPFDFEELFSIRAYRKVNGRVIYSKWEKERLELATETIID